MGSSDFSTERAGEESAYTLGVEACLWGRPLVEYHTTLAAGLKARSTRIGGFRYFDELKTAADRFIVTPNNVTIDAYGTADLRLEPLVVWVPSSAGGRWYIVQISDFYDEIAGNIAGFRGSQPGLYVVTGPDYRGDVPPGMSQIKVRTRFAGTAVRVLVSGEPDLPAARAVQRGIRAMPLSAFEEHGLAYADSGETQEDLIPAFEPVAPQGLRLLEHLGFAMQLFLSTSDGISDTFIRQLRRIGLTVAGGFEWRRLDEDTRRGLTRAVSAAEHITDHAYFGAAMTVDGWRYTSATGRAGHNFALRAAYAKYLLGANVPEELVYPNTAVDGHGDPLTGEHRYQLRFAPDRIPPVSALWNMSMYDRDHLFIHNHFGRYSIGSTTEGLKTATDGSITILIQHEQPPDTSNWLPAPESGPFNLTMRLYGAQPPVLDGTYRLPPVTRT